MRTLLILVLLSGTASAHITMTSPTPRTTDNKAGPCGATGSTRGSHVATFAPGEKITVEWDETIDHPGHYRIAFDSDGDDVFINPSTPDDNYPFTLMDMIPDKEGGHYTQAITLPTTLCDNCTLQLMQIMTTVVPYDSFYYQCADITIAEGGGSSGGGGGSMGGCSTSSGSGAGAIVLLAGLFVRRRQARRSAGRTTPQAPASITAT